MRRIELKSSPKGYTLNLDKVLDPETTVKNAVAGLAGNAEVELVERASAIDRAFSFTSVGAGLNTSGKGLTIEQARASAIMEFVERHAWLSFDYRNYPGYRVGSYLELAAAGLPLFDDSYFLHNYIELRAPEALHEEIIHIPLKWVPATVLTEPAGRELYYPLNWHNMLFSSNGLASGNTMEEAIVQALCELIERENIYRLFVERRVGVDVDPASITHPLILRALEASTAAGIEIVIKEISSDLVVPTIIVRGTCEADAQKLTYQGVGQGTHPDPEKALIRALSEYFESFSIMASAEAASPIPIGTFRQMLPRQHHGFHALYNPDMLDRTNGTVSITDLPNLTRPDFKQEAEVILGILAERGIEVAAIDKTNPAVGIPVVRLFAPLMRSILATDFTEAPDMTLSAVFFEAGLIEASKIHYNAGLNSNPAIRAFISSPLGSLVAPALTISVAPDSVWGRDYLESLARIVKSKKGAVGMLEELFGKDGTFGQFAELLEGLGLGQK